MADDAPAPKKENVFTRKIGPMPMWAWVSIIAAVLIGYVYFKNKQSSNAASSASVTPPVIEQFQLNTPPTQEDEDDDDKKPKHGKPPKEPHPFHHHERHKHRKHPEDEHGGRGGNEDSFRTNRAATLQQVANARHWTPGMLRSVEREDHLSAGSKLRRGQTINVPWER